MLFAYLDESYMTGQVHLVGAYVVTQEELHRATMALDDVLWKTSKIHPEVQTGAELHGQQLFQRSGDWSCLRAKPAVALAMYRRSLLALSKSGGKWFVGGVRRIDRLQVRYSKPWPPHQIALQYVLEMVDEYASGLGETVRVIADHVDDEAHHQARINQFQLDGRTPGWRSRDLRTIDPEFRWEDSRSHRGLQAADLLTYVYLRKMYAAEPHPRTVAEIAKLADTARPLLHASNVWTP